MTVSLIVAFDKNRAIGHHNQLPWHLPADLKHFKKITMGHSIVMGRKTYESIGRPLPGRKSVVVTNNPGYWQEGITVVHSIEQAIHDLQGEDEIFIIGGAQIFRHGLELADRMYTTLIHHEFEADTWFPEIDLKVWKEVSREDHSKDEKNPYDHSFINYERVG